MIGADARTRVVALLAADVGVTDSGCFDVARARSVAKDKIREGSEHVARAEADGWRSWAAVRADQLQAEGDARGDLVAMWLVLPDDPRTAAMSRVNDGLRDIGREWIDQWEQAHRVECPTCRARSGPKARRLLTWEWTDEWSEARAHIHRLVINGWRRAPCGSIGRRRVFLARPCPGCDGRGDIAGCEVECKACEGRGHPLMQQQVIYPDGSNGWTCRACSGSGRTIESAPDPVMGHASARLWRSLLAMLDGYCPWAPSARKQPSECTNPRCESGYVAHPHGWATRIECPRCCGTRHNLAGYVPAVELFDARW
jgi:hypothetical protein